MRLSRISKQMIQVLELALSNDGMCMVYGKWKRSAVALGHHADPGLDEPSFIAVSCGRFGASIRVDDTKRAKAMLSAWELRRDEKARLAAKLAAK